MYKIIAKIGSLVYCAVIVVVSVVCTIRDANKNLVNEVCIEAGTDIHIEDFFKKCPDDAKFETDVSQIDTNVPSVYQLTVKYSEVFVEDVTLRIEDHTAPKGIALPKNQYASLEWPDASECVGCLYDLNGIAKVEYRDGTPKIQYTGDYMVPVVVTDWYDNSTVIEVPFHVTDDHNAPLFYGIHDIYIDDSKDTDIDYFEGVTYVDGSLALDPARLPEFPEGVEPTITATVNEDGTVTFACQLPAVDEDANGIYDYAITGTEGAIATFNVAVASTVTPGDVQVVVNANTAIMVEPNGTATHTYEKANTFTWTIEEGALLGDVNMDGAIDIADVNKVLELMATSTTAEDYPAGDVNGDGGIDIADVNKVLEIMAAQTGE